jgi:hypothetical protein
MNLNRTTLTKANRTGAGLCAKLQKYLSIKESAGANL